MIINEEMKQEIFEFLDELKESGTMNMMAGAREVQNAFSLSRQEAIFGFFE